MIFQAFFLQYFDVVVFLTELALSLQKVACLFFIYPRVPLLSHPRTGGVRGQREPSSVPSCGRWLFKLGWWWWYMYG